MSAAGGGRREREFKPHVIASFGSLPTRALSGLLLRTIFLLFFLSFAAGEEHLRRHLPGSSSILLGRPATASVHPRQGAKAEARFRSVRPVNSLPKASEGSAGQLPGRGPGRAEIAAEVRAVRAAAAPGDGIQSRVKGVIDFYGAKDAEGFYLRWTRDVLQAYERLRILPEAELRRSNADFFSKAREALKEAEAFVAMALPPGAMHYRLVKLYDSVARKHQEAVQQSLIAKAAVINAEKAHVEPLLKGNDFGERPPSETLPIGENLDQVIALSKAKPPKQGIPELVQDFMWEAVPTWQFLQTFIPLSRAKATMQRIEELSLELKTGEEALLNLQKEGGQTADSFKELSSLQKQLKSLYLTAKKEVVPRTRGLGKQEEVPAQTIRLKLDGEQKEREIRVAGGEGETATVLPQGAHPQEHVTVAAGELVLAEARAQWLLATKTMLDWKMKKMFGDNEPPALYPQQQELVDEVATLSGVLKHLDVTENFIGVPEQVPYLEQLYALKGGRVEK